MSLSPIGSYRVTPKYWGDGEPDPNHCLKVFDEVHQKSLLDLLDRSCGANYVVGSGVEDVDERVVVHHKVVVTDGSQIVGTPYNGGRWY